MRAECAQGFLIGRPMTAASFEAWMVANRRTDSAASA
jgi:EAL domain-containing protein (putative c-di-GMP-specific phosphodiesterase class I)